jgi:hypothetical protein
MRKEYDCSDAVRITPEMGRGRDAPTMTRSSGSVPDARRRTLPVPSSAVRAFQLSNYLKIV